MDQKYGIIHRRHLRQRKEEVKKIQNITAKLLIREMIL